MLTIPTFAGLSIFGLVFEMPTIDNPRDEQKIAIPGADGMGALDMGHRGRVTNVNGVVFDYDASVAVFNLESIREFQNGRYYPLYDTLGREWPLARLFRLSPAPKLKYTTNYGYMYFYTAEFHHLF
jgi:hypothetical protein